jgi:phosphate transport system substrate-binding protein
MNPHPPTRTSFSHILHHAPLLLCIICVGNRSLRSQTAEQLPLYQPHEQVSGTIRIGGSHHHDVLLKNWEEGFHAVQPGVRFENTLKSTANAVPALSFGLIDIGIMGRGILPLETLEFRRELRYPPTELAVATGSYDVTLETAAFAIIVRKDNPLAQLSLKQLDAIFGYEHKRGASQNIRTWDQLGLTGEWVGKSVHTYGFAIARFDRFFEDVVFAGSSKWNPDIHEYSDVYPPDGNPPPTIFSGTLMMKDLAQDKYGIAYCSIASLTPQVKAIALSEADSGPFVPLTAENVANRSYPLSRSIYMYVNRAPGKALEPAIEEFLRYILSRDGQRQVSLQKVYYPLTPALVQAGLNTLH